MTKIAEKVNVEFNKHQNSGSQEQRLARRREQERELHVHGQMQKTKHNLPKIPSLH